MVEWIWPAEVLGLRFSVITTIDLYPLLLLRWGQQHKYYSFFLHFIYYISFPMKSYLSLFFFFLPSSSRDEKAIWIWTQGSHAMKRFKYQFSLTPHHHHYHDPDSLKKAYLRAKKFFSFHSPSYRYGYCNFYTILLFINPSPHVWTKRYLDGWIPIYNIYCIAQWEE
jgi:hypothetical protein